MRNEFRLFIYIITMLRRQRYHPHHVARTNSGIARRLKPQRPSQSDGMQGRMHDDSCALILETTVWKTLPTACANLRVVIDARVHAYLEEYLADTGRLLADNHQRGFYKHLDGAVGMRGRKTRIEQFIMDRDGTLLMDKVLIRKR